MEVKPVIDPLAARDATSPALLLMRHPQTVFNLERRYLGQENAPLSKLGELQRERAVEGLVAWGATRIVTSPLSRCRAIADEAAQRLGLSATVDEDAIELCFGVLEGLTQADADAQGLPFPWGETADRWPCAGGEPLDAFFRRTARACNRYARLSGRTALISHGGAIRAMCCHLMNLPDTALWHMSIDNVSSAIFNMSGGVAFLSSFGLMPEELRARSLR